MLWFLSFILVMYVLVPFCLSLKLRYSMLWCYYALVFLCFGVMVLCLFWIYDQLVLMLCELTLLTSFFFVRVYVCICMSTNLSFFYPIF
ncbi:hypothetical protein EDC96DRAFT_536275 [Choanephora cucurbitarum]|nr:hypothetical protein EDC96DRAFT_539230 [Choanephora cucurbitarum]KAI8326568.1 hypothetical protein EDC96DRAFT_536262 [Choanephora cucurbitarum]KAI8326569.1 hypothetical protein EDC96DRAFT_536275 [Choanephora cucurbitarum]